MMLDTLKWRKSNWYIMQKEKKGHSNYALHSLSDEAFLHYIGKEETDLMDKSLYSGLCGALYLWGCSTFPAALLSLEDSILDCLWEAGQ